MSCGNIEDMGDFKLVHLLQGLLATEMTHFGPFKSDAFLNGMFRLCIMVEEMAPNGRPPHAWGSLNVPRCGFNDKWAKKGSKYSILAYFWPFLPFSLGSGFRLGLKLVRVRLIQLHTHKVRYAQLF